MDPTAGVTQLTGNFSGMKTNGIDVQISSININKAIEWTSSFNFNYAKETVTRYDIKEGVLSFFSAYGVILPQVGKPLYGLYSYRWAGLDPQTGDPRFYISDTISEDYSGSLNDKFQSSDIVFSGKYRPPYTGSLLNTISWRGIDMTFNLMYKFGHYFRRKSINYSQLMGNWRNGHQDYALRWQKPGDEAHTDVPSFIYPDPSNGARDAYYTQSTALIEKADHIRLQFINIGYNLNPNALKGLFLSSLRIYFYANNLGIIWRANDKKIDPDYPYFTPPPRTYSFGIYAGF
jgi:TonB-dependent starch-binding outer membrane protein SusC